MDFLFYLKLKRVRVLEYVDDEVINAAEGWFGIGKRRYSHDKIMTELTGTSETVIALISMVMNLDVIIHFWAIHVMTSLVKETNCIAWSNYFRRMPISKVDINNLYIKCNYSASANIIQDLHQNYT